MKACYYCIVVSVGDRMSRQGRKVVMQHKNVTPCLCKYTILYARDEFFSFLKILQVSSLLKELNGKLLLK